MNEFFFKERGLYYRINDFKKNTPTLVFVHGVYGSSSAWLKHEQKFLKSYNVLSYDLRGHGKSHSYKNYKDYKIDNFVEDLNDLVTYLKIEKFILIGHSMGSLIVLDYILKYQEKITSAILLSPNINTGNRWIKKIINKPLLRFVSLIESKMKKPRLGDHVDYSKYPNSGDWDVKRSIADLRNTGMSNYLYCVKHFSGYDRRDNIKSIKIPLLIIHGEKDSIFPIKNSIEMAKKIPNSKLVVLKNANHILVINYFDDVSKLIDDFIKNQN
jgi:pimeloyl-ACP methyl ester carboxylesterase